MIPYVKWYPSDWLASTASKVLSYQDQGIYRALLDIAWKDGPLHDETPPMIPDDGEELAWKLGISAEEFTPSWKRIRRLFKSNGNGKLFNPRQLAEYEKALAKIEQAREAGAKGGKAKSKRSPSDRLASAYHPLSDPDSDTRNSNATSDELLSKTLPGKKVFRKSI